MKRANVIAGTALLITAATSHTVAADDAAVSSASAVSASSSSSGDAASATPNGGRQVITPVVYEPPETNQQFGDHDSVDPDALRQDMQVNIESRFLEVEETNIDEVGVDFDTDIHEGAPPANAHELQDSIERELRDRTEKAFDDALEASGHGAPSFGGFDSNYFQRLTNAIVAIPGGNTGSIPGYQDDYLPIDDESDDHPSSHFTQLDSTTIGNPGGSGAGGGPAPLTEHDDFGGKSLEILELEQAVCELQATAALMEIGHIVQQHGDDPTAWDKDTLAAHEDAATRMNGNEAYCKRLAARIAEMKGAASAAVE